MRTEVFGSYANGVGSVRLVNGNRGGNSYLGCLDEKGKKRNGERKVAEVVRLELEFEPVLQRNRLTPKILGKAIVG